MKNCKVCGSPLNSAIPLQEDFELLQCTNCNLISDHILYDDAFLKEVYGKLYSANSSYNSYLIDHENLKKSRKVKKGWHVNKVLRYIDKKAQQSPISIFEFGAGIGQIAEYYKDKKNITYSGIEFDSKACEFAQKRGCNVSVGSITAEFDTDIKYDIIFSFEVIEHISDFKKMIENINSLLNDKGIFTFSTPNFDRRKNYNDNKLHQERPPVHINFFNLKTTRTLFSKFGMNVKYVHERPYPFLGSPYHHWFKTLIGRYHGATLVAVVEKK